MLENQTWVGEGRGGGTLKYCSLYLIYTAIGVIIQVQVEIMKPPLVCTSAFIEPVSADDLEVMVSKQQVLQYIMCICSSIGNIFSVLVTIPSLHMEDRGIAFVLFYRHSTWFV